MIWVWRITGALALPLAAGAMFLAATLFSKVQQERTDSLVRSCLRDSDQSQAIIGFLGELGSKPATIDKARLYFPVLTRAECETRASESVGPPPLPPK